MAFVLGVRANTISIPRSRLAASVLQSREFGSSKEPLRKEISFQPYTDEFVKRGKTVHS